MKPSNWFAGLLMASVLAFAGCGKSEKPVVADGTVEIIDATKFRPAFEASSPEIKTVVDKVMMSIQDSFYQDTLAGLGNLANRPDLTEAQKKVVADLTEQVKRKMAPRSP